MKAAARPRPVSSASVSVSDWRAVMGKLRAYVRGRVAPAAVDDVTGDILLRLIQHQQQLANARNPSAWMYRVAANAVADHHRRRDTQRRYQGVLREEPGVVTVQEPRAPPARRELTACLRPLMRRLTPIYAQALQLTEIDGATQATAARQLGISLSAMKSRVQRGRAQLKAALLRCCEIELSERGAILDYRPHPGRCDC